MTRPEDCSAVEHSKGNFWCRQCGQGWNKNDVKQPGCKWPEWGMGKDKAMSDTQDPKQLAGSKKIPWSCMPMNVVAEACVAIYEGARKYGRHNFREEHNHFASTYYEGTKRHLVQWWEGEDIDSDSGLSHVTKAIASLVVLRDTMIRGTMVDDRPPPTPDGFWDDLNKMVEHLNAKYPDAKPVTTALSVKAEDMREDLAIKSNAKTGPLPRTVPRMYGKLMNYPD